ncbi:WD40 repeat [Cryptosporidium xiaoi]|uniref:WD40 repeat n=1 Tax=Cryptosporidium xiaoi TaxID=659607 RepID=A0AAV9Y0K8_9CRYT
MSEKRYKGGRFSLRVPPVFCGDGNLIAIPRGRRNLICFYNTVGNGEILYEFSLYLDDKNHEEDVITGLTSIAVEHFEFVVASTYSGSLSMFLIEENCSVDLRNNCNGALFPPYIVKQILGWKTDKKIIDLKNTENYIFVLVKDEDCDSINSSSHVSLYKIEINEIVGYINSKLRDCVNNESGYVNNFNNLNKMVSFSYGASNLTVSKDETLFCFTWKNILVIWTPKYKDKIIRFRHSEFILSVCLSEKNEFIATGDAYGRLTYWFLPSINTEEWSKMWNEAPFVTEKNSVDEMIYKYGIKTSMSHWHSHELKALSIIPESDVVISGGEEAVLVLWRQNDNSGSFSKKNLNDFRKHNNGSRQFIPRLGAPIYTITTYIRRIKRTSNNENTSFISEKITDIETRNSNKKDYSFKSSLPQLISGIVCSDNSIKIIDLVHTKIINCIYGISTPFSCIKKSPQNTTLSSEDVYRNSFDMLVCNMKLVDTKFLNPSRLLVSIIGNPFRLQIHDVINDLWVSSVTCRSEETYVSGVGEGLSSSKLYKYKRSTTKDNCELEGNSARIFISNAYFSNNGDFVVTVECQKYDHLNGNKRTYNLKFWRIEHVLGTENSFKFNIISKYQAAHIDEVISIQEILSAKQIDKFEKNDNISNEESSLIDGICFLTITKNCEIKCWTYKEHIKEWINFSIIGGCSDKTAYSACFNDFFDKLLISTSNGILVYNWSKHNCILFETSCIQYKIGNDEQNCVQDDFQIISLTGEGNSQFILGFSTKYRKLVLWDINTLELITELDIKQELDGKNVSIKDKTVNYYKLKEIQNSQKIHLYTKKNVSFKFAITSKNGSVLLFNLFNEKSTSNKKVKSFKIKLIKKVNVNIQNEIDVIDSAIQYVLCGSKISFYIVLLLSSCEIYSELVESLERLDSKTHIEVKDKDEHILDIRDSISRMYISSSNNTQKGRDETVSGYGYNKNFVSNSFSEVSDAVKDIISGKFKDDISHNTLDSDSVDSSLSTLFSIQETAQSMKLNKHLNVERISENLNTFMCPSAQNLLWNILTDSFSGTTNNGDLSLLSNKKLADLRIRYFVEKPNHLSLSNDSKEKDHEHGNKDNIVDEQILYGLSLRPTQTQKLQSILKKATTFVT